MLELHKLVDCPSGSVFFGPPRSTLIDPPERYTIRRISALGSKAEFCRDVAQRTLGVAPFFVLFDLVERITP